MPDRSPLRVAVALLFAVALVTTGAAFVTAEQRYVGWLDRDTVSATVTDLRAVEDDTEPAAVTVRVHNPTAAEIRLRSLRLNGVLLDGEEPVARTTGVFLGDRSLRPGERTTVTARLRAVGPNGTAVVREGLATGTLRVGGTVAARVGDRRLDVPVRMEEAA